MRTLLVNTFVSLDGIMQAPGGPDEDRSGGFGYGGWQASYWTDPMTQVMEDLLSQPFELVLGRRTYEIFAGYWPHHDDNPIGAALNAAVKHVASRTLTEVDWANSRLIDGDVVAYLTALKQSDGPDLHVHGSANLIDTLLAGDLIDEYQIWTFPVLLGTGKRLFDGTAVPQGLRLVDSTVYDTGAIRARYQRAGAVPIGDMS